VFAVVDRGSDGRRLQRQRFDLLPLVCCPQCRSGLTAVAAVRDSDGIMRDGRLSCPACDDDRAAVRDYRLDFLRPVPSGPTISSGRVVHAEGEKRFGAKSPNVGLYGPWTAAGPFMRAAGEAEAVAVYEGRFSGASLRLQKNAWSGVVSVQCDDEPPLTLDLYRAEGGFVEAVPVARDLPFGQHRLVLRSTGERNPAAHGAQVFFQEVVLHGPLEAGFDARPARNYGNPYSDWILRHLSATPTNALVLEIGGGDRRTENPRHINLEYMPYELPDCFGDIHRLPFRDAAFDVICSQAVFEHVRNPYAAADELARVVRPGGTILTEVAFLQPLHGVPHHYFNMTVDGLKAIFEGCDVLDEGWFGDFSQTVSWMADVAGVKGRLAPGTWAEIVRLLLVMDGALDDSGSKFIASGVRLAVRRPEAG
jgi:SAM-dependent methyltransferase